jgi:hypothetical protein
MLLSFNGRMPACQVGNACSIHARSTRRKQCQTSHQHTKEAITNEMEERQCLDQLTPASIRAREERLKALEHPEMFNSSKEYEDALFPDLLIGRKSASETENLGS